MEMNRSERTTRVIDLDGIYRVFSTHAQIVNGKVKGIQLAHVEDSDIYHFNNKQELTEAIEALSELVSCLDKEEIVDDSNPA